MFKYVNGSEDEVLLNRAQGVLHVDSKEAIHEKTVSTFDFVQVVTARNHALAE